MTEKNLLPLDSAIKQYELDRYVCEHTEAEPEILMKIRRKAELRLVQPRMMSGHIQGRLLKMLVHMVNPRRVLEIGTYTGYATICMAEALGKGAEVYTIEFFDELESFIKECFEESGYKDKITLLMGDALELIPTLQIEAFDLVYIDANKRHYVDYIRLLEDRLPVGSFIVADNTLWGYKVIDPKATDSQTLGIRAFNDMVVSSPRFEPVVLPIRDGLTLIRKVK